MTTNGTMRLVRELSEIAGDYDAIFCDVWGVVHDGVAKSPAAEAALRAARERGVFVVLLTNSPRPRQGVVAQLDALGVSREAYDVVVTSGDATRAMIAEAPAPIFHIGAARDLDLFAGLDLCFGTAEDAATVVATGLVEDERETPADYAALLDRLAARSVPMVCANPDIVVHRGERLIHCAGALGAEYVKRGQTVHLAGKPHAPIYQVARDHLPARSDGAEPRVLCIGDGLFTDVKGANAAGADCLFVTHGIHRDELDAFAHDAALLAENLDTRGLHARFAARELR